MTGNQDEAEGKDDRSSGCVILFVKYPEPGRVKTRLTPPLTPDKASELYRNFVLDQLDTLDALPFPTLIFFSPSSAEHQFREWLGAGRSYFQQAAEEDLGTRMKEAFRTAFSNGFDQAVLIGSDVPDLPAAILEEANTSLESYDTVLGPSTDGGYYLIGFRKEAFLPEAFDGIDWSTGSVFLQTLEILVNHKRSVHTLSEMRDIDTIEDLSELLKEVVSPDFSQSHTMRFIKNSGIFDEG